MPKTKKDKQHKVLVNINHDNGQNNDKLAQLQKEHDDECFTAMQDIWNELSHWTKKFKNKNVICPCDWDIINDDREIYSIRIDFDTKEVHGHLNNVSSIQLTNINASNQTTTQKIVDKTQIEELLRTRVKCNFIRTFWQYNNILKCKSITASGYNPETNKGIKFQDVDFTKYDICVTNPPFSAYKEFLPKLIKSKIKFIILAPYMNRNAASEAEPLFLRKAYLGYGRQLHLNFSNPTRENQYHTKIVNCDWLVSWPDAQKAINKNHYKTGIKYEDYEEDYPIMENMKMKDDTVPLRIADIRAIPDNYSGWMFVSSGFLDRFSWDDWEWYPTKIMGYWNSHPKKSPFKGKIKIDFLKTNGQIKFNNYVIKRKHPRGE